VSEVFPLEDRLGRQGASLRARRRRAEDCPPYQDRFLADFRSLHPMR